ncbi:MAG: sucrose-6-phosphate hydrolase [Firmicutes bacterium]|nr:sucrose-6-phosphate hydrolase [Bacillota bacterium]
MKEWSREERYKVLESADQIKDLYESISKSVYRQAYHVQPITGLSSDPNGFTYLNGTWHLFYQWTPWGAVHGLKYWYHVTSKDLISWKNEGVGLHPDTIYDNKGCHSGSAICKDDELYFFYTGNHRNENWERTPWTCAAKLVDGKPVKLEKPLFGPRDDYSEHQRDPKVFYNEEKQMYYIFIGAQTLDLKGCVQVYKSKDLLSGWEFAGQLKVPGYESFGGMWECPCIERIGDTDILLFSPQYTKLPGRSESTNHNVYLLGKMDFDTLTFTPNGEYKHLDYGFDFYAAQLASNVQDKDKAIIISWIGLPDNHYPTEEEDYEGSMTLPRELRIVDGKLIQTPLQEMEALRKKEIKELSRQCELLVDVNDASFDLNLFTKENGEGGIRLHYEEGKGIEIDRTGLDKRFNEKVGEVLTVPVEKLTSLQIFVDHSSIEYFINGGEAVFTSHMYPTQEEMHYTMSDNASLTIYELTSSVSDDFVV